MDAVKKDERKKNILFVDNDATLMNDLKDWIKKSEIESKYNLGFYFAKDAKEALKKLRELEINLMIVEILLPIVSGYHLIKAAQKEKKDLSIIIYSTLKNPQDLAKMASAGVNNIFLKELMSKEDLIEIIRKRENAEDIDQVVMELNSQIKALHTGTANQELKLIQCPNCHLILAPDSHFCNSCGQQIFKKAKAILNEDKKEIKNSK